MLSQHSPELTQRTFSEVQAILLFGRELICFWFWPLTVRAAKRASAGETDEIDESAAFDATGKNMVIRTATTRI
jgi:hypothetical protein